MSLERFQAGSTCDPSKKRQAVEAQTITYRVVSKPTLHYKNDFQQPAVDVAIMASRSLNDVAISDVLDKDNFIGVDSIFDDSDIDPDLMEED
ncbi:hypothetical protein J6590_079603 [Homalodisca vitripennis]|nr:hypothetical protein J6590_079603 [Homalodisca vitripennis]